MMKSCYFIAFPLILLLLPNSQLRGQSIIDGELRPRAEWRHGYKTMPLDDQTPAFLVTQRTRLGIRHEQERLVVRVVVQDVRTWGDQKLKDHPATMGLHEGWAQFTIDSVKVKLGRQPLIYDNQRLLGYANWQQRALVHDAALVQYTRGKFNAHLGLAFNQVGDPLFGTGYSAARVEGNYKSLGIIWFNRDWNRLSVSFLGIQDGFHKKNDPNVMYFRNTAGMILKYKMGNLEWSGRGFYQSGRDTSGSGIDAVYLNPDLKVNLGKPVISIGLEYFSGNAVNLNGNTRVKAFHGLYGAGHSFNGHMDYFSDVFKDAKGAGLVDYYVKSAYKLGDKLSLIADAHYFSVAQDYYQNTEKLERYLGVELDLGLRYVVTREVDIQGGFSTLSGSSTLEVIKGGDKKQFAYWSWIMITVKPSFFKS